MNIGGQTYGHVLLRFTFGKKEQFDRRLFASGNQAMGNGSYIFWSCGPPIKFGFQDTDPEKQSASKFLKGTPCAKSNSSSSPRPRSPLQALGSRTSLISR